MANNSLLYLNEILIEINNNENIDKENNNNENIDKENIDKEKRQ